MEYTQNYQLPLWDKEDAVLRTDFNENNQKIDAAVMAVKTEAANALANYKTANDAVVANLTASMPKIAVGSYTGDGTTTGMEISVGFAPRVVLVWANRSAIVSSYTTNYCGMAIQGQSLKDTLTLTDNGFFVKSVVNSGGSQLYPYLNATSTYFYFAIG